MSPNRKMSGADHSTAQNSSQQSKLPVNSGLALPIHINSKLTLKSAFAQQSLLSKKTSLGTTGLKLPSKTSSVNSPIAWKPLQTKISTDKTQETATENTNLSVINESSKESQNKNISKIKETSKLRIGTRNRTKKDSIDSSSIKSNAIDKDGTNKIKSVENGIEKGKLKKIVKKNTTEEKISESKLISKRKKVDRSDSDSEVNPKKLISKEISKSNFIVHTNNIIESKSNNNQLENKTREINKLNNKPVNNEIKSSSSNENEKNLTATLESEINHKIEATKNNNNKIIITHSSGSCKEQNANADHTKGNHPSIPSVQPRFVEKIKPFYTNDKNSSKSSYIKEDLSGGLLKPNKDYSVITGQSSFFMSKCSNISQDENNQQDCITEGLLSNINGKDSDKSTMEIDCSNKEKWSRSVSTIDDEQMSEEDKDENNFYLRIRSTSTVSSITDDFISQTTLIGPCNHVEEMSLNSFDTFIPKSSIDFNMKEGYYKIQYQDDFYDLKSIENNDEHRMSFFRNSMTLKNLKEQTDSNDDPESGFQTPDFDENNDKCMVSLINEMESIEELASEIAHMNTQEGRRNNIIRKELDKNSFELNFKSKNNEEEAMVMSPESDLMELEHMLLEDKTDAHNTEIKTITNDIITDTKLPNKRKKISRQESENDKNKEKKIKSTISRKISLNQKSSPLLI